MAEEKNEIAKLKTEIARLARRVSAGDKSPPAPPVALSRAPAEGAAVHDTAATMAAATAKAEVEARFLVALNRPRSVDAARVALLNDCRRFSFAEAAEFHRPVGGGETAVGPSIRFAEGAARCWKNLDIQTRVFYDSPEKRKYGVQVTDLESNVTYGTEVSVNKTVERKYLKEGQTAISSRKNSRGETTYLVEATEDDMLAKGGAECSKALRINLIRHIPGDLVEEARGVCARTVRDQDRKDPDAGRKRIVDSFAGLGVPVAELADFLGHDLGSASPAEINLLRGVYTSLKQGDVTWSEVIAMSRQSAEAAPRPPETTAAPSTPGANPGASEGASRPTTSTSAAGVDAGAPVGASASAAEVKFDPDSGEVIDGAGARTEVDSKNWAATIAEVSALQGAAAREAEGGASGTEVDGEAVPDREAEAEGGVQVDREAEAEGARTEVTDPHYPDPTPGAAGPTCAECFGAMVIDPEYPDRWYCQPCNRWLKTRAEAAE